MDKLIAMRTVKMLAISVAVHAFAGDAMAQNAKYKTTRAAAGDSVTLTVAEVEKLDAPNAVVEMLRTPDEPRHVYLIVSRAAKPEDISLALSRLSVSAASSVALNRGARLQGYIFSDPNRKPLDGEKAVRANEVIVKMRQQGQTTTIPGYEVSRAVRMKLPLANVATSR